MNNNQIIINNWDELLNELYKNSWNEGLERYRSNFVFRGLNDASYDLQTSLMRLGGNYPVLEKHIIRNFCKYAHGSLVEFDSIWNWLSLAQHHGLPTRMLDWTYSPLIAAHFATANLYKFNEDSAIWAVDYYELRNFLPKKLKKILKDEGANVFTVKMLSKTVDSLEDFMNISDSNFLVFMEPPSIDQRITNQFALFSLMSDQSQTVDQWLAHHPNIWKKIIIKSHAKWEIRDKLDQANITERVLFPGLDGLGRWLKRVYTPKASWIKMIEAKAA